MKGFLAERWKLKKVINISKTQMCCFLRDWYLKSQMTNFRLNLYTFKKWYSSKAVTNRINRVKDSSNYELENRPQCRVTWTAISETAVHFGLCILAVFTEKHLYYSDYSIIILANTVSIPVCLPKFTFTVHSPTDPMSWHSPEPIVPLWSVTTES